MNAAWARGFLVLSAGGLAIALTGCGGGGASSPPPAAQPTSYIGTNGDFAAAANPGSASAVLLVDGIAGKRQYMRGTVDPMTGKDTGQPAGFEIYKAGDGHVHAIDLVASGAPVPVQVSSEAAATIDDACSFGGATLPGASSDYAGTFFAPDYATAAATAYFYRLPGADGACNTADDVIHMVRSGMSPTDAPLVAAAMPAATIYTQAGEIAGFVARLGANLVLLDRNGANPLVLATYANPIQVATVLPSSNANGLPTGNLFDVDGNIVYVDYVGERVSAPLFTIPGWTPQTTISAAAAPATLYFAIDTPASGATPPTSTIYAMPANGSAAPVAVDTEAGHIFGLSFPVQSTVLDYAFVTATPQTFSIEALPAGGGASATLVTLPQANSGRFTATATTVYYTGYQITSSSPTVQARGAPQSGIVATSGAVIAAPTPASEFLIGGEQVAPPAGAPLWTPTGLATVFRLANLTANVTATTPAGVTITTAGLAGATLDSIDTTSNQVIARIGTLPASNATYLTDTFRTYGNVGYLEAINDASTANPATRDLYLLDTRLAGSLQRITGNL